MVTGPMGQAPSRIDRAFGVYVFQLLVDASAFACFQLVSAKARRPLVFLIFLVFWPHKGNERFDQLLELLLGDRLFPS